MNIRARVRARLSPRVRPHRSRLSSGRSRGQIRAPLSTASTAVRFAANASRCVLSHYVRAPRPACVRPGAETPPLADVSLVRGIRAHSRVWLSPRRFFFPVVPSGRYLNDRSGRRGANDGSTPPQARVCFRDELSFCSITSIFRATERENTRDVMPGWKGSSSTLQVFS